MIIITSSIGACGGGIMNERVLRQDVKPRLRRRPAASGRDAVFLLGLQGPLTVVQDGRRAVHRPVWAMWHAGELAPSFQECYDDVGSGYDTRCESGIVHCKFSGKKSDVCAKLQYEAWMKYRHFPVIYKFSFKHAVFKEVSSGNIYRVAPKKSATTKWSKKSY